MRRSFWFLDSLHRSEVEYPFDTIVHEAWTISANAFARRVFLLPASDGFIARVLNGRLYQCAIRVDDPEEMERRAPIFGRRASFYLENWRELLAGWKSKMEACIADLKRIEVPELPELLPDDVVTQASGVTPAYELLKAYDRVIENVFLAYQYHFEMHLCGYGAYLHLFQFWPDRLPGHHAADHRQHGRRLGHHDVQARRRAEITGQARDGARPGGSDPRPEPAGRDRGAAARRPPGTCLGRGAGGGQGPLVSLLQREYDLTLGWSHGGPNRARHWQEKVARHRRMLAAIREWTPEPALGPVPEDVNEPFTIMLWGITPERIQQWLAAAGGDGRELHRVAGSPGAVEGPARVILSVDQLASVEEGEILVCPVTAPTWGVVFGKVRAAVVDTGGIMSHAAIVCREYGLPAVVGTVHGTRRVRTGDRVRVDGSAGLVTILSGPEAG